MPALVGGSRIDTKLSHLCIDAENGGSLGTTCKNTEAPLDLVLLVVRGAWRNGSLE